MAKADKIHMKNKIPGGNELLNPHEILVNQLQLAYGSQVADLGCGGAGYFVMQSSQITGPQGKVHAVDIQKSVLSDLESKARLLGLENIKTLWSNLEKFGATPINDNTVDYSLLINILFQNTNHLEILKEAVRLTKKGGKILIIDWQPGRFPIGPAPDKKISLEQINLLAQTLNLKKIKDFNAGQFHYGIIFQKQ